MNTEAPLWIKTILEANQTPLRFDHFMDLALYHPEHGYYTQGEHIFGAAGDFITAPEISPLFGQTLAHAITPALRDCGGHVWEFGAGQGKLAAQLIKTLGPNLKKYHIVDVSSGLKNHQAKELKAHGIHIDELVAWETQLPQTLTGVVIGNEVLDAMPVRLFRKQGKQFYERYVKIDDHLDKNRNNTIDNHLTNHSHNNLEHRTLSFCDMPITAELNQEITKLHTQHGPWPQDYVSEWHEQAYAFIRTLTEKLHGLAIFIDYGFGASEFYHPQRNMGTLVAHQRHQMHSNVLTAVGQQDLSTHINFSGIYDAMQQAGGELLGYTSQAAFLLKNGILNLATPNNHNSLNNIKTNQSLNVLLSPAEMGELFKVMVFCRNINPDQWQLSKVLANIDRSRQL